jgi:hypothetical protein
MPIRYEGGIARLEGDATVEEALELADWLHGREGAAVDLAACTHLHTAILQTLLALRPPVAGPPADPFLARWVAPLLATAPTARPAQPRRRKSKNEPEKAKAAS